MHKYLAGLVFALVLTACAKKEEVAPETTPTAAPKIPEFPLIYGFTNAGDSNIDRVFLFSFTWLPWPNSSRGTWQTHLNTFTPVDPQAQIMHLPTADHQRKTVYPGCITQMDVTIVFKKPVWSPFPNWRLGNRTNWGRKFIMPDDSVTHLGSAPRIFHWPQDTLKYREVQY